MSINVIDLDEWYAYMDANYEMEGEVTGKVSCDKFMQRTAGLPIDITTGKPFAIEAMTAIGDWFMPTDLFNTIIIDAEELTYDVIDHYIPETMAGLMGLKPQRFVHVGMGMTGKYKSPSVACYKRLYLGKEILCTESVPSISSSNAAHRLVNTPENLEYYGYLTYKGRAYSPGIAGYHSTGFRVKNGDENSTLSKYRIGFEIEKESPAKASLSQEYITDRYNWGAERDGSLGSDGYELVSPIYNLLSRKVITDDFKDLSKWIDGGQKDQGNCGGHINVSQEGCNGFGTLKAIRGFIPLLYAMYPDRCGRSYARAQSFNEYLDYPSKRAFYPKSDRLEIRIFPVVKDVDDITNRYELVRYMMTQKTKSPITVVNRLLDPTTRLHNIVTKMDYEPLKLAQEILDMDAKYDKSRYSSAVHLIVKAHGLTISTSVTPTVKQKKQLKKQLKELLSHPMLAEGVLGDIRSDILGTIEQRVERECF